jgi:hypothetical protein
MLLRHMPAYFLLTYKDERNRKMFHRLRQFVRPPDGQADRQIGLGALHSLAKMLISRPKTASALYRGCVRVILRKPGRLQEHPMMVPGISNYS